MQTSEIETLPLETKLGEWYIGTSRLLTVSCLLITVTKLYTQCQLESHLRKTQTNIFLIKELNQNKHKTERFYIFKTQILLRELIQLIIIIIQNKLLCRYIVLCKWKQVESTPTISQ